MRLAVNVVTCFALFTLLSPTTRASILVDFSPETVVVNGGSLGGTSYGNTLGNQILADNFTWAGGELTGASIFSSPSLGSVGDAVRVIVHSELGAGKTPVIDISTTIDVIDRQYTRITTYSRKHASFAPVSLAAGDYYFYMTGAVRFTNIGQGTGFYDDGRVYVDQNGHPDIDDFVGAGVGDLLFQLEGNSSAVPEPATIAIWVAFGFGAVLVRNRFKQYPTRLRHL